jgi:two-component system chemotaxis response regulator CheY
MWCDVTKRILVVDDSEIARRDVTGALRLKGYEVIEAGNGQEGLELFQENGPICMVLADLHMPVMNGIQMCEEIGRLDGIRMPPVLMVTSESSPELKARGKKAGIVGWVVKPIDLPSLLQAVDLLITRFNS